MPKLKGLLSLLPPLENIPVEEMRLWLKRRDSPQILENEIGNRLLYPLTTPVTDQDLMLDYAILRESLKMEPQKYFSRNFGRLYIPDQLIPFFSNLQNLIWVFIDVFNPVGIVTVYAKGDGIGSKNLGSIITPTVSENSGQIELSVDNRKYRIKFGSMVTIPSDGRRLLIKFESDSATLQGKNSLAAEIFGGPLGIVVDARIKSVNLKK